LTSVVTDNTTGNTATLVSNTYDNYTSNNPLQAITGTVNEHDASFSTAITSRGNVTSSSTPTTNTTNTFDITGTVTSTVVNGVTTNVTTGSTTNYAAPTQLMTTGVTNLTTTLSWTSFLGLHTASDPNTDTGSINYDPVTARPTSTTSPYGAVTNYTYNDSASPPNMRATTNNHWVETVMDGFGRTTQTITGYTLGGTDTTVSTVDTQYAPCGCSPLGKMSKQSQPYGPTDMEMWTKYTYDASGRTLSVVLPDGSTTMYQYQGNLVTATDPAGNWKSFTMDGLGNLVTVQEPDPTLGTVTTSYVYDALSHLISVSMPRSVGNNPVTQTRTFNYTLGTNVTAFLQNTFNPESGTVNYAYNPGTNTLKSKTDFNGQHMLTYQYDGYNRLQSVTNATGGGSQVLRTYWYDYNPLPGYSGQYALGKLAMVQYAPLPGGTQLYESHSYVGPTGNGAGLPNTKELRLDETITNANCTPTAIITGALGTQYYYDNEGGLTQMVYPSTVPSIDVFVPGPTYNYGYDNVHRLNSMTDVNYNPIVGAVSYNAANQLTGMTFNGITESRSYNSLNQLTNLTDQLANTVYVGRTYNYPTGTNNGKISSMVDAVSGETVRHPPRSGWLDELGRLKGGWCMGEGVAPCAPYWLVQNCPPAPSAASCSRM